MGNDASEMTSRTEGTTTARRYRDVSGGAYTWYNWDLGWTVLNEENEGASKTAGDGALSRTYVNAFPIQEVGQVLAHFECANPTDSDYRYYLQDNIRSTRNLFNHSKTEEANYGYTPYGEVFARKTPVLRPRGQDYLAQQRHGYLARAGRGERPPLQPHVARGLSRLNRRQRCSLNMGRMPMPRRWPSDKQRQG